MIVAQHRHEEDEIIYVFEAPSIRFDREILHFIVFLEGTVTNLAI